VELQPENVALYEKKYALYKQGVDALDGRLGQRAKDGVTRKEGLKNGQKTVGRQDLESSATRWH
jgi:hypothetical protein